MYKIVADSQRASVWDGKTIVGTVCALQETPVLPTSSFRDHYVSMTCKDGIRSIGFYATTGPDGRPNLAPYSWTVVRHHSNNVFVELTSAHPPGKPKDTAVNIAQQHSTGWMALPHNPHEVGLTEPNPASDADEYVQAGIEKQSLGQDIVPPSPLYLRLDPTLIARGSDASGAVASFPRQFKITGVAVPENWVQGGRIKTDQIHNIPRPVGRSGGPNWIGKPQEAPVEGSLLPKTQLAFNSLSDTEQAAVLGVFFHFKSAAVLVANNGDTAPVTIGTHGVEGCPQFSVEPAASAPLDGFIGQPGTKLVFPTASMLNADGSLDLSRTESYDVGVLTSSEFGPLFTTSAVAGAQKPQTISTMPADRFLHPRARGAIYTATEYQNFESKVLDAKFGLDADTIQNLRPYLRYTSRTVLDWIESQPLEGLETKQTGNGFDLMDQASKLNPNARGSEHNLGGTAISPQDHQRLQALILVIRNSTSERIE